MKRNILSLLTLILMTQPLLSCKSMQNKPSPMTQPLLSSEFAQNKPWPMKIRYTSASHTHTKSNVTLEQLKMYLKDTPTEGLEAFILECENKYSVNAKFIVGVAGSETTYGKHGVGKSKNNLFGIKGYSYKTKKESIDHFCRIMKRGNNYHSRGRYSIKSIGRVYCPPNTTYWAKKVVTIMNRI